VKTKIKTIEIIINGTEKIKQDWSNHDIEVEGEDMFARMEMAGRGLATKLYEISSENEKIR